MYFMINLEYLMKMIEILNLYSKVSYTYSCFDLQFAYY